VTWPNLIETYTSCDGSMVCLFDELPVWIWLVTEHILMWWNRGEIMIYGCWCLSASNRGQKFLWLRIKKKFLAKRVWFGPLKISVVVSRSNHLQITIWGSLAFIFRHENSRRFDHFDIMELLRVKLVLKDLHPSHFLLNLVERFRLARRVLTRSYKI
jgi:hypothetical protein